VPAYRKKWFWLVAAALVVVVGVGTTLAVLLWPGYPALDYRPLDASKPVTFAPAAPVSIGFQDTAIIGDRAYFASVSEDPADAMSVSGEETLGVVAADTKSGERLWQSTKAGKAERWERMVALPQGLVVFTDTNSTTSKRRMAVLGAEKGDLLWQRTIDNDDGVLFSADVAVLVDRVENRLLGLALADGKQRWEQRNVRTDSGTSTSVVAATTPADLSGPAGVSGVAFSPDLTDDTRIVQVAGDKSFRVIDAENGDVLVPPRQGVAAPSDEMIAHNGRFIVRESTGGTQRLLAYDLTATGEPDVLFSAPANVQISELTACGDDRVCWIETTGFEIKTTQVAGLNVAEGDGVRRRAVPNADSLAPVGEHVLATQSTSPSAVSLIDPDGKQVWNVPGRAARLDGGNLLRFNQGLSTTPDNPALHGEHLGDDAVPLGALNGVRSATCSWNTSVIACMADETFMVQRFAD
jgi:outer membrane protein assembly factor BamB